MLLDDIEIEKLNQQFENESPQAVLRFAAEHFGRKLAIVTSFQHTGVATLHMMHDIAPKTDVLTLDTGLLFPETYDLMDKLEAQFGLNLHRIRPEWSVEEQAKHMGDALWERDPNECCHIRKVVPLDDAIAPYDAWITGLRRDQTKSRANTPFISRDKKRPDKIKFAPFAAWTEEMVNIYIKAHDLPYNALYDQNYLSIGCWPCTRPVLAHEDARAGRWANSDKVECGIHTDHMTA